jgi:hypothetical protein
VQKERVWLLYRKTKENTVMGKGLLWHNIIVSETHVAISIFEESNITKIPFYLLYETMDTTLIYCEQ